MYPRSAIIRKRECTPHADGSSKLYDSDGNLCNSMTSEDKIMFAITMSLCGIVLAILAMIYLLRLRKARARDRIQAEEGMLSRQAFHSPLMMQISSASSYKPDKADSTKSPTMSYSPYADSEQSHMPILSADGHLLPTSPAPSSWSGSNHEYQRPLPTTPVDQYQDLVGLYSETDIGYDTSYYHGEYYEDKSRI